MSEPTEVHRHQTEAEWGLVGRFRARLDPDERQELYGALLAQMEECEDVELYLINGEDVDLTGFACGACGLYLDLGEEHHCDLAPAGESAEVTLALMPTLVRLAGLMEACFRLTIGRSPSWLEVDTGPWGIVHSDLGAFRMDDFVEHYTGGMRSPALDEFVNRLEP